MNKSYLYLPETMGTAIVGGLLFAVLHVPLPWLLGPITAISAWRLLTGRNLYVPPLFVEGALLLLGYMLGSSFTKETALEIANQLPWMALTTAITIVISLGVGMFTARRSKLDIPSVVLGSVPGGLSQMLVISREIRGIDPTVVVFIQIIRVLSVVFIVPFIAIHGMAHDIAPSSVVGSSTPLLQLDGSLSQYAFYAVVSLVGFFIARRLRFPTSVLTGPLLATAAVMIFGGETAPHLPPVVILLSQLVIGINIGLQVKPEILKSFKIFGVYSIGGSLFLILAALLMALGLTVVTPINLLTGFLSTAPGGIAEMGITATVVHADLSMVSGYHLFRVLFILLVVAPLVKRWIQKREKADEELKSHA